MARLKYLGIIPARGGSKGIPRKNIKPIAGKPLVVWTIEAALASRRMDAFVVSTDDAEIAEVCRKAGAEVVMRPPELARDDSPTVAALQHCLSLKDADNVVILQPTSPVREAGLIDRCIERFEAESCDNLGTGFMSHLMEYGSYTARRQDLKGFFHDDGSVYVVKSSLVREGRLHGDKVGRVETSKEQNFEIDDAFDFWLNEQILLKNGPRA